MIRIGQIYIFTFLLLFLAGCEEEPPSPVVLQKGLLWGTVQDSNTDQPIAGAIVKALSNEVVDTTDNLGLFQFDSLALGLDTFMVFADWCSDTLYQEAYIQADSQSVTFLLDCYKESLYLYVGTFGGNEIYIVDLDRQVTIDSLYFTAGHLSELTITPGGTKIYIETGRPYKGGDIYYIEVQSGAINATDLTGSIRFSPQGDGFLFNERGIFSLDTLVDKTTPLLDMNNSIVALAFNPTASVFYFTRRGSLRHDFCTIYFYDYVQNYLVDSLTMAIEGDCFALPLHMTVTPDGSKLFFTSAESDQGAVRMLDLASWEVSRIPRINRRGKLVVTPDGRYVLITDPGKPSGPFVSLPTGYIAVVSTNDDEVDGFIDVNELAEPGSLFDNSTNGIVITPSGQFAFVSNGRRKVFMINVNERNALQSLQFESGGILPMVLGPKFK